MPAGTLCPDLAREAKVSRINFSNFDPSFIFPSFSLSPVRPLNAVVGKMCEIPDPNPITFDGLGSTADFPNQVCFGLLTCLIFPAGRAARTIQVDIL